MKINRKKWKIGSDVREEDIRDKSNYEEIFHQHTKQCRVTCVALHIKNCSYSKFRPNKRRCCILIQKII